MHEMSKRPYTAPRLIRPDAEGLSPEGKKAISIFEDSTSSFGPS
ncbi:hypothetical protein [Erythrobacter sp. CCH5-A1]|nr:hypothetical protein [Erythrobacter sp. CCH5-A1]